MPHFPITLISLSFAWPDASGPAGGVVLDDVSLTIGTSADGLAAGPVGLVAPNGAGKSTLLRILAGALAPTGGAVTATGRIGYLPQALPLEKTSSIAAALGISESLAALRRIESGAGSPADFTAIGDDWDLPSRALAVLSSLGLAELHRPTATPDPGSPTADPNGLDLPVGELSGGQAMLVGLARILLGRTPAERPDTLLLDEPTNNLDRRARNRLYEVIDRFPGTVLIASHDRELLERCGRIVELRGGALRGFDGNFTAYRAAIDAEQEAAAGRVQAAKKQVRVERADRQHARERQEHRSAAAARRAPTAGIPKILLGARKRSAQETAGRTDGVHAARLDAARDRLDSAERELREDPLAIIDIPATALASRRIALRTTALTHRVVTTPELIVAGPERIELRGPNGSGKSTLLRLLLGEIEPESGAIERFSGGIGYLSQRLDNLDPALSVAENFANRAPNTDPVDRMNLLARYLFRGAGAHRPVAELSGGEQLRANLLCLLHGEPAPQLLILDEPTNNLDLDSVAQLERALAGYRGALIVVSHDPTFVASLHPTRLWEIAPAPASSPGPGLLIDRPIGG